MNGKGISKLGRTKNAVREYSIIIAWVVLCVILSFATNGKFMTPSTFTTMLRQASIIAIVACGQYFVMIGGAFDLSLDGIVALCGVIFAGLIVKSGLPIWLSFIITILLGAVIGAFNGILV